MLFKVKIVTFNWFLLIAYCIFIFIQSSHPSPEIVPTFRFSDKLLHYVAFAIMGVLFYRAFQPLPLGNSAQLLVLLSMVCASLYGISDEIHQHFVPYRHGSLSDVIADVLGAVSGVYLYHRWVRHWFGSQTSAISE
jgi:VanZ family protein